MVLTAKTKYALNIIGFLSREPRRITKAKEIADTYGLSPSFVETALRDLRSANIIKSQKGPGGGYSMSDNISNISIGDIISATGERSEQQELFADDVCGNIVNSLHTHINLFYSKPLKDFL